MRASGSTAWSPGRAPNFASVRNSAFGKTETLGLVLPKALFATGGEAGGEVGGEAGDGVSRPRWFGGSAARSAHQHPRAEP